ncbi:MAG: 3-hydroxyacyl-CoA dehydrogenase family protein [Chloroflexota bacterium]
MKVIVAGEYPLAWDIGQLCLDVGHETHIYVAEDLYDAQASGSMMDGVADVDLAIEAQNETVEAKRELLLALAQVIPDDAPVLSSTMVCSATEAASWIGSPQRLVGFGLLPPLSTPGIVELAPALQSKETAMEAAKLFWQSLEMKSVLVADGPGLVRARTVCCLINEATAALFEGVASAEDIDTAMRLGTNYPHGPFEWADIIGVDTVLGVMNGLFREWGEDRYRPSPLLKRMVLAGHLGRKSGRGFYDYDERAGNSGER